MAILDAWAEIWAEQVNLTSMIKDLPLATKTSPDDEYKQLRNRTEARIYGIVRQAFQEGALAAITNLDDEHDKLRAIGFLPRKPSIRRQL